MWKEPGTQDSHRTCSPMGGVKRQNRCGFINGEELVPSTQGRGEGPHGAPQAVTCSGRFL